MKKTLSFIVLLIAFCIPIATPVFAQEVNTEQQFFKAQVESVEDRSGEGVGGEAQLVRLKVLSGDMEGEIVDLVHGADFTLQEHMRVKEGEVVVVSEIDQNGTPLRFITETYRLPAIAWIVLLFFVVVTFFGRKKGITSIVGLVVTVFILVKMIVPWIVDGMNPLTAILLGSTLIAFVSLYIAHGFSKRTSIALGSTILTFVLSAGLAWIFVLSARLFGYGSEEVFFLQGVLGDGFDFRGLLLGGMLLGALGVLDDITTGQSAAIEEIHRANTTLSVVELYKRGLSIGREHIASLVNTLLLAYAGASFPVILLVATQDFQPLWVTLNNQLIAEEIIRTLVGSFALVLAVPITTIIAAVYFGSQTLSSEKVDHL